MPKLSDVIKRSIVLCYKEDVTDLRRELDRGGLPSIELRPSYTQDELRLPANTRTFINHRNAWEIAARSDGYTLICEADFVPCLGMADMPVFWPLDNPMAWGYLYQGSPRLLSIVQGRLRGHCAPLVAYVVNNKVAETMLQFFSEEMKQLENGIYGNFDAHLQWSVMGKGAEAYIPMKHYGEHGGKPNPEHASLGTLPRAGRHRADILAAPLAFLPQYAEGSKAKYWRTRLEAGALGWMRLASGRWIIDTNVYSRDSKATARMYWTGLSRLLW